MVAFVASCSAGCAANLADTAKLDDQEGVLAAKITTNFHGQFSVLDATRTTLLAVSAMTTIGYAGILAGPPVIGFVAQAIGLHNAFWVLALLMCLVPVCARRVAPGLASLRRDPGQDA